MISSKHSVSVAGVIINDENKILVIQRDDNSEWQIPGGVLELNETIQSGLKREIFEETSVNVEIVQLSGVYKNLTVGVVALVFRCKYLDGIAKTSSEAKEVEWLSFEDAEKVLSSTFKTRVSDAFSLPDITNIRNHDGVKFIDEI